MSFNPIVANLLATENLTVIQTKVSTACFNVVTRVLEIPTLLPEFEGAYGMLIAHEVGHALYTLQEFNNVFLATSKLKRQYYNVCEDIRIEKLIKREYPGLRRVMAEGYTLLNSMDFFIPKGIDPNTLNLIDRINVFFKGGPAYSVRFTHEERELVNEASDAESWQDTVIIADKIYALASKPKQKAIENDVDSEGEEDEFSTKELMDEIESKKSEEESEKSEENSEEKSEENSSNEGEADDAEDDEGKGTTKSTDDDSESEEESGETELSEGDKEESKSKNSSNKTTEKPSKDGGEGDDESEESMPSEESMSSVTQERLDKGIQNASDTVSNVVNLNLESKFKVDPILSFKTILDEINDVDWMRLNYSDTKVGLHLSGCEEKYKSFITSTQRTVSYLFKEFELKKSAHKHRYATTSRSGQLNMNKIFSYQLRNDLFKSITITPDAKNHGMLFLVDWSGSMRRSIHDTLCQIIALTSFCRRAQIPFKVLAFSSNTHHKQFRNIPSFIDNKDYTYLASPGREFMLLELFSSDMNERQYSRMARLVYSDIITSKYSLGNTPLNQALIYMHSYVRQYKAAHKIEKLSFVVLSDGASSDSFYAKGNSRVKSSNSYGSRNTLTRIVDPITKEVHKIVNNDFTGVLLKMIAKSSGSHVVGFFICSAHEIPQAVTSNCPAHQDPFAEIARIQNDFKTNGYSKVVGSSYDNMYFVKDSKLTEKEYEPVLKETMSTAQLAREMIRVNKSNIANKIVLGKIIADFA